MTLKNVVIKKSKKAHKCFNCGKIISKGSSYRYLFGFAEREDPAYAIKLCFKCCDDLHIKDKRG